MSRSYQKIEKIPVRGYRKLTGIWNRETCNGKGWYRLFNYFKYKPTLCYFKKAGHDENGNTRYEISLFNNIINVTRYFNLWRMKPGKYVMVTNECGALDVIKEKFDNINIVGKCEELRFRGDGACFAWRKATVDEIVEHFKNR